MDRAKPRDVTGLLTAWSDGDPHALDALIPVVYEELRRIAARSLRRERSEHTLQATALAHEAFVRLVNQREVRWQNRAHFFAVAAQMIRRILVDHARRRASGKRGTAAKKVALEQVIVLSPGISVDMLAVDEALTRLAVLDPQLGRIVEMRFFGGLTVDEVAEVLRLSPRTVKREWHTAKAWLHHELSREAVGR